MPILILIAGLFLAPPAAAAGEAGCIYDHSGAAQLLKAGGGSWAPAWKGLPLAEGDRVRTGDKGWCEVLLKDGTFVKLDAGSEALVSELRISTGTRSVAFEQLRGKTLWMAAKVKAAVESKFSVRTPSAVCAVRGTDFSLLVSSSGGTTLGLFEGRVAFSSPQGGEKEVTAGGEASAEHGAVAVQARLSRLMQAEERRYGKLKGRVERLRQRLAEREDYLDEYINRRRRALSGLEAQREEKLSKHK